jgi:putative peptidoglycan lipid II flippase
VQIAGFIDQWIASFLATGMLSLLGYAQTIYMLPISIFGIGMSAAELTEMSRVTGTTEARNAALAKRLVRKSRQVAYFVVPSAVAIAVLGDVILRAVYRSGQFTEEDVRWAWPILATAAIGLVATTVSRLYQTTFYAMEDTRTPTRIALGRLALSTVLGFVLARHAPGWIGIDSRYGAAGLPLASGIAGWIEFAWLRRALRARVGDVAMSARYVGLLWLIAGAAAMIAYWLNVAVSPENRFTAAAVVLSAFGLVYLGGTTLAGLPEGTALLSRLRRSRPSAP